MDDSRRVPFKIFAIVAMDQGRAIGFENRIPWHLPEDQKRFSQLTSGQSVLMGRKTYESLPEKFRPLPRRKNIVITRKPENLIVPNTVSVFSSVETALATLATDTGGMQGDVLWILGGGQIYCETLPLVEEIYLTEVEGRHQGDVFFPQFESQFRMADCEEHESDSHVKFRYSRYVRIR